MNDPSSTTSASRHAPRPPLLIHQAPGTASTSIPSIVWVDDYAPGCNYQRLNITPPSVFVPVQYGPGRAHHQHAEPDSRWEGRLGPIRGLGEVCRRGGRGGRGRGIATTRSRTPDSARGPNDHLLVTDRGPLPDLSEPRGDGRGGRRSRTGKESRKRHRQKRRRQSRQNNKCLLEQRDQSDGAPVEEKTESHPQGDPEEKPLPPKGDQHPSTKKPEEGDSGGSGGVHGRGPDGVQSDEGGQPDSTQDKTENQEPDRDPCLAAGLVDEDSDVTLDPEIDLDSDFYLSSPDPNIMFD